VSRGGLLAGRARPNASFAGVTHIDVTGLTQAQADDINGLCASRKVSLSALGFYPNPLDPDPIVSKKAVEHFKKVIVAAK
jgi:sugar phosphate isomerase/epimerase